MAKVKAVASKSTPVAHTKNTLAKVARKAVQRRRRQVRPGHTNRKSTPALCLTCRTAILTFVNGYMKLKQCN